MTGSRPQPLSWSVSDSHSGTWSCSEQSLAGTRESDAEASLAGGGDPAVTAKGRKMQRWQFALFSNPASGDDGVTFSHPQTATLVQEFSAALGRGLKAEN